MKKIIALFITIAMIAAIPPALAIDGCDWDDGNSIFGIQTIANVVGNGGNGGSQGGGEGGGGTDGNGGGGDPPIIKCKWEYDLEVILPPCDPCMDPYDIYHDACPYVSGLQVKPQLGDFVTVGYYAIVTDPQGVQHVDRVFADIWHPNGEFKYQIELFPVGFGTDGSYDKSIALSEWYHASSWHYDLITFSDWERPEGWSKEYDIEWELKEEEAYLFFGTAEISYCQPGGYYTVAYTAYDGLDMWCEPLWNMFWYIPTAAIEIDFTTVDYGNVVESVWQQEGGDKDMFTPTLPTVKNIGNCPVFLTVYQDDMNFGMTGGNWNVEYKARMNEDGEFTLPYWPYVETLIPGTLGMCTQDKLDFLIHVIKGFPDGEPNIGSMILTAYIDGSPPWSNYLYFPPPPQGIPELPT
jgi:hypothetical protein